VVRDEGGQATGMRGITMDITERLASEQRLRYQLSFTAAIANSLVEGIYAVDPQGRVTFMNPAAEQLLGYRTAELIGRDAHQVIHHLRPRETPYPAGECSLLEALRSGQAVQGGDVYVRKDGSLMPVSTMASPIVGLDAPSGVVLAFQDESARRHAEQLRNTRLHVTQILVESDSLEQSCSRLLEVICDSLGWDVGILWLVDPAQACLRAEFAWSAHPELREPGARLRGLVTGRGEGLAGRVWATGDTLSVRGVARAGAVEASLVSELELGGAVAFPLKLGDQVVGVSEFLSREVREPDEDTIDLLTIMGNQIGLHIERKRAEAQLVLQNRELQTLLYVISHDLKEPLRGIENFSELLSKRYGEALDERGRDFLMRIRRGGSRLSRLIEDIVQLSRARQMKLPEQETDGEQLVQEALARLEHQVVEAGAKVTVVAPLGRVRAEKTWAVQALFNLIANALKFTLPGQPPAVTIEAYTPAPERPGGPGFVVSDRGPGVPAQHSERIFELFQRGVGREVEGTGAGLAIARTIARRHGGDVWYEPRPEGGSRFSISFGDGPASLS